LDSLQRYAFPGSVHEIALEELLENIERQTILKALDRTGDSKTTTTNYTEVAYETFPSTQPSPG
jgi:DNA-binding NtrC family response regulator